MTPRDVTPKIHGLPGLPKWLDRPLIKRTAEKYDISEEEAREHFRLNTLPELELVMAKGEIHDTSTKSECYSTCPSDECRTETCLFDDRETLSEEPQDAPEISPEDGW